METTLEIFNKLEKGIYFEDSKSFLEWNVDIKKLAYENSAKIITESDRTILNWGEHSIFNGLILDLTTTFLLSRDINGIFNSIQYKCVGDKLSIDMFDKISSHLINLIGNPRTKEDSLKMEFGKNYVWTIDCVEIRLYLFEQHCYKLSFTIEHN